MKKARIVSFALLILISLISFTYYLANHTSGTAKIKISTNPWVGFAPFMYAQEKGWLENTPFEFLWLVDLSDNARMYERGFTQGFTATQYELLHLKEGNRLQPAFLIDRSFGADAVVSNKSLSEIRNSSSIIDVYLEQGSLNDDFFDAFVKEHRLDPSKFRKVDATQKSIATLQLSSKPILILSYQPYLSGLLKKGFHTVASTRTMDTFFVIDALFVNESLLQERKDDFQELKEIYHLALTQLKSNPKEFYSTVEGYLEGQSYEEFLFTTTQLQWLHQNNSDKLITHLNQQNIKTDRLLP